MNEKLTSLFGPFGKTVVFCVHYFPNENIRLYHKHFRTTTSLQSYSERETNFQSRGKVQVGDCLNVTITFNNRPHT